MKIKNITIGVLSLFIGINASGCDILEFEEAQRTMPKAPDVTYVAEMYDNHGQKWFEATGKTFDIAPNKVKEYAYNSSGSWEYSYDTSAVVSVDIDGYNIETCGSTVLFADSTLEKLSIDIPEEVIIDNESSDVTSPSVDMKWRSYWNINLWWKTTLENNQEVGRRVVIVQSQQGDPIGMYTGNEVFWGLSEDLPKTTEITIDGKKLFIHRANFAIIDADILK